MLRILEKQGGARAAPGAADDLSAVRNNTYQMMTLLAEERPRVEAAMGPILEFVVSEGVLERLLGWHLQRDVPEERKVELLKLFEMLVSQAHQPLLRHKPVLAPLLRLLGLCAGPASPPLESSLVLLLNQLCVSAAREPPLLELFFHSPPAEPGPTNLLVFSLLIPFIHHEGLVGQQARDALLLLMALSAGSHTVAQYITEHSYFCPVRGGAGRGGGGQAGPGPSTGLNALGGQRVLGQVLPSVSMGEPPRPPGASSCEHAGSPLGTGSGGRDSQQRSMECCQGFKCGVGLLSPSHTLSLSSPSECFLGGGAVWAEKVPSGALEDAQRCALEGAGVKRHHVLGSWLQPHSPTLSFPKQAALHAVLGAGPVGRLGWGGGEKVFSWCVSSDLC